MLGLLKSILWSSVLMSGFHAIATTLPSSYGSKSVTTVATQQLRSLQIEVGDRNQVVSPDSSISVIRGQKIKVIGGTLAGGGIPQNINVVGFKNGDYRNPTDDTGHLIDTSKELLSRWSTNSKGKEYFIVAESKGIVHGVVKVRLQEPTLKYVDLMINGRTKTVRPGEGVFLQPTDQIKVSKVITNLPDTKKIDFEIISIKPANSKWRNRIPTHEIRLSLGNRAFAMIPITVAGI